MIYLDKYAYFNNLKNVHPIEKFIFAILTLIIVLSSNSITLSIIVFLLITLIIILKAKIPFNFYFKLILLPTYFLIAGVLTIALNIITKETNVMFSLAIINVKIGITQSSFYTALKLFFKALGSVTCLYFITLTVPMIEIINILKKIKIPKLFLELMIIIYRFIFVLLDTFDRIHTSQVSRLGYKNISTSLKSLGKLISTLFIISLKRSEDIHNALESRCFNGEFNFLQKEYSFSLINVILIIFTDSFLIVTSVFLWGKL